MDKFIVVMMYVLWTGSLLGVLVVAFTNFKYVDLNVIVGVLLVFTLANSLLMRKI